VLRFRAAGAAIVAGALAAAGLACTPPPPHSTLTSQVDAGLCRTGALDGGVPGDDGGVVDAGACAPVDAASDHQ
jgi:hypothetical protein